jgi:hypothetical protein
MGSQVEYGQNTHITPMYAQYQDNITATGSTICVRKVVDLHPTAQQNHLQTTCLPLLQSRSQDFRRLMMSDGSGNKGSEHIC